MLLKALIPAGWMPSPAAPQGEVITLCTEHGPVQMVDDTGAAPTKPDERHGAHRSDICPFAAAPVAATPPLLTALTLPDLAATPPVAALHTIVFRPEGRFVRPSPRAPPRFV